MSEHGCIHMLGHCCSYLLGHGLTLMMDTPVAIIHSYGFDTHDCASWSHMSDLGGYTYHPVSYTHLRAHET